MSAPFVIVDVETTGFGRHDRVVEVAAITVDPSSGEVIAEYDTLVNPERDTGPVDIHGVTASMVEAAPSFDEIAGALALRLDGAVLVAHNISFDSRMLSQEYDRLGVEFLPGSGFCTLRATSEKLANACSRYGVDLSDHHRALSDARATADLFRHVLDGSTGTSPIFLDSSNLEVDPRTLRREVGAGYARSDLARIASVAPYPSSDSAHLAYLDLLDWVLDDLVITSDERREMLELAHSLGLSEAQIRKAHSGYVTSIVAAARRDNVITKSERWLIETVASALEVEDVVIPDVTELPEAGLITAGMSVCFTGQALVDGLLFDRAELEQVAATVGLQPVSSVTKKGCDLLVAADVASMSGKAKKAMHFGIPVMSVEEFVANRLS